MAKPTIFSTSHTSEQIAYLAGIIDGEGCFYIGRVKQGKYGCGYQFHTCIKIDNTCRDLIEYLNNIFGGRREYAWHKKAPNHNAVYVWTAQGPILDYLCPLVLPYLVVKRQQCELMMQIRKTYKNIGSKRLPDDVVAIRTDIMIKLRQLNSRWHDHPLKQNITLPLVTG